MRETTVDVAATSVWVADLAAYVGGRLAGEWVDASDDDALDAEIARRSRGGESDWAIFDYDGSRGWTRFAGAHLREHPSLDRLRGWATLFASLDDVDAELLAEWISIASVDLDDPDSALDEMREALAARGAVDDNEGDLVESMVEDEVGDLAERLAAAGLPTYLASYVDWEDVWSGEYDSDGWSSSRLSSGELVLWRPV
jgi:hypothetical protein